MQQFKRQLAINLKDLFLHGLSDETESLVESLDHNLALVKKTTTFNGSKKFE